MRIHILFRFKDGPWGGGNQFLKALKEIFQQSNLYTDDYREADVILFNSNPSSLLLLSELIKIKYEYSDKIIVNRIDGPVFLARDRDLEIDKIFFYLSESVADGIIFQSNWCKENCIKLGYKKNRVESTILNAPNTKCFSNFGKLSFSYNKKIRLIATSWSSNWKKGFETYRWLDEHLDFSKYEMTFVGNSPISFKNIRHLQPLKSQELAAELRAHDISIFASEFEACSNTLLEALHCGLPVIAKNATSNPEVLGEGGELFDRPEDIPDLIALVVKNYESYQKRIRVLYIDEVAERYYAFMQKIHTDKAIGHYKPKRLTLLSRARLESTLLRWKLQERVIGGVRKLSVFAGKR